MVSNPTPPTTEVHYRFIPKDNGVTLELWEPVPLAARSLKTYRFCVRYDLVSRQAAYRTLEQYLNANPCTEARSNPAGLTPTTWGDLPALTYT
ncbi:MAG: hypothetical protein O2890_01750 [Cyanobacteria bacterium]|nr:hypothetical protein [Cyanobacteriota bacterium]